MNKPSRLWIYILVNILVSAVTTLIVLIIWENTHPAFEPSPEINLSVAGETTAAIPDLTPNPATAEPTLELISENVDVIIRTVVGSGNLTAEYVEIYNQSEGAVDLTDWQLNDAEGQQFTFPTMILNPGGAISIHSKTGDNTVIELYWQADAPIWQSGEEVRLLDGAGALIASYSIP